MKIVRALAPLLILCFVLSACGAGPAPATATATVPPAGATDLPAPTATEPPAPPTIPPTLIPPTPTSEIPWEGFPTPAFVDPSTPVPYPVRDAGVPEGIDAYVVLGSDKLPHRTSLNTDVVMLLFLDRRAKPYHLSIVSIPRDLYVYVPGHGMDRINTAYALGGDQAVFDTMEYNFGVRPKQLIVGDMSAFLGFIDYLGGVDVNVTAPVFDKCGTGDMVNYAPGTYHMGGVAALCYVRVREGSSDYDRMRREQEVTLAAMKATIQKMGSDPVGVLTQMFNLYKNSVHTTVTLADVPDLALAALSTNRDSLMLYRLVPPLVTQWTKPTSGAWLLLPPPPEQVAALINFAAQGQLWPEPTN